MKSMITFITLLSLSFNVYSQEQGWTLRKAYKTTLDLEVYYNEGPEIKSRTAKKGLKYNYVETIDNKIYIKFIEITKDTDLTRNNGDYVNASNDDITYYVEKSKLTKSHRQKTSSLVTGTLLAPIKIRPETNTAPWELSTDITLGQYLGYRFPISRTNPYYLTVPTFTLGTSLLSINKSNTTPEKETSTTLGLTWSAGIILDLNGFNIGLLVGKDYAPGSAGEDWIYNEETWFSIGFGINLTSKNKDL